MSRPLPKAQPNRRLAWAAVGAVWLSAAIVGVWIGLDLGRALFH